MFTIYFFLDNCQRCNFSRVFQVVMSNFEKIEGKRKGSINYVHQGFIYTKNNADSIKTRLRCHRWRDGCKGTAFIQENTFHVNINCSHEPEMSEVKKRKVESEIKNAAGSTCTPLRQIYDKLITKDSNTLEIPTLCRKYLYTTPPNIR